MNGVKVKMVPATVAKRLSSDKFEKMCHEAAKHSTGCREYICGVLARLCRWLGIADRVKALHLECEPGGGNVQRVILELYRLLDEKCLCDFDALAILNLHRAR